MAVIPGWHWRTMFFSRAVATFASLPDETIYTLCSWGNPFCLVSPKLLFRQVGSTFLCCRILLSPL